MRYLPDKSALSRVHHADVARRLHDLHRQLCTCTIVDLEVLYSAQSLRDWDRIRAEQSRVPHVAVSEEHLERAISVRRMLAARGQHRGPSVSDLLIAAVAEGHGVVVLHYDKDFDMISRHTGQVTEWVVEPGTVP